MKLYYFLRLLRRTNKGGFMNLVAVAQMCSQNKKDENLEKCLKIIMKAHGFSVKLLCFPENFAFLGATTQENIAASESLDGPTISLFKTWAKKYNILLSLGGFQEKIPNSNLIYNTHMIISERGEISAVYRKIHLFSVKLPDNSTFDEAKSVKPGANLVLNKIPVGSLGLSICYDLRFSGLYNRLRAMGADILLVPAAFTKITGEAHWEILLRARAIENQCFVLAAAQSGQHFQGRESFGHAMIVDPWGKVLAQCQDGEDFCMAKIDLDYLRTLRKNMPVYEHSMISYG